MPEGIYGSRMTGITVQRYVDIGIFNGVISASLSSGGEQITRDQFRALSESTTLINDLIDLRSDTMRKTRENPVLRGARGNLCTYLDNMISRSVLVVAKTIADSRVCALVIMAHCNWVLMASHHKLHELAMQTKEVTLYPTCTYKSLVNHNEYEQLLVALKPYGTLGKKVGPCLTKTRKELDMLYHTQRTDPKTHMAWIADATRIILDPINMRKWIDVVHYKWEGNTGDVDYCP
ncbi:hypothetical protein SAMD00019534_102300 [Acytostelium subglobosum LB1]|uniref:hypothetical protein n=1 Tax=Acytostelium subglobosum LB1 TaxID=1410327 RepID=UPI0006448B84|nr:hypothetical protein SAMD00019534_102300 [Acytostelium subglobosum LB1]GAM27055.1 hypothetical protein SAMD00019534_102300 [Acytostelium subglobosum LB1]|eukprot:XP_012749935.1 hypothetical protein SAMD00019534_102300 [Acytostelium subglobosum LB1]